MSRGDYGANLMRRTSGKVSLVYAERRPADGAAINHLELRRSSHGTLAVEGSRYEKDSARGRHRWSAIAKSKDLRTPMHVKAALDDAAIALGVDLSWTDAIHAVARLDWISAAVIATTMDLDLPRLPPTDVLLSQRSLRALDRVEVGVEWGGEMHSISLAFERWCRILGGEPFIIQEPYTYDGEQFIGDWKFNDQLELEVGYGDGAVGWAGGLVGVDLISGPIVDDIDVARAALLAARPQ